MASAGARGGRAGYIVFPPYMKEEGWFLLATSPDLVSGLPGWFMRL